MKIISLGWGVQSFTLAAMSALGELPTVDYCVHADTTWEHQHTYRFAKQWQPWLESCGIKVITVKADDTNVAYAVVTPEKSYKYTNLPLYSVGSTKGSGLGQIKRQCTSNWKIDPVRQFVAAELARRGLKKTPGIVEQWIGISTDEWQRAKDSDVKYITHRYPLIEAGMSRNDCINWLTAHGLQVPGKSSCVFCPYHNSGAWRELKRQNGPDWEDAVAVDEAIRYIRPPYPLFVHRARVPLREAVVIPEDFGAEQGNLFNLDDVPCDSGVCFL